MRMSLHILNRQRDGMSEITLKQVRENKYLTFVIGEMSPGETAKPIIRDLNPRDFVGELYHPGVDDSNAYRPGNELASEYTALQVLWKNFITLFERAKGDSDSYSRKLTLKFAVVELRSFLDALPRFGPLVAAVPPHDGKFPRSFVCLTQDERSAFERKAKELNTAKKELLNTLTKVRNSLGAHMSQPLLKGVSAQKPKESLSWQELESLWQLLEPRMFLSIARAGHAFLAAAKHLPLYEFYRYETPKRIRVHVPAIAEVQGLELRLRALSPSLVKQIEELAPSCVEGTHIVFRRDPIRLRVGWPEDLLVTYPWLKDSVIEV